MEAQIKKRQEMFSKDIDKAKEQIITVMKSKLEGMNHRISEQKKTEVTWMIKWEKGPPWNRIKMNENI